ncbi:MAG: hypothetical protein HYI21_05490 [Sediminibacterium sp. Gen4]|jgi:hypothetical protein|uniref:hypothetical protein n=1 Tax=unclassified Sediminibacterium TaxID=2635961 RepID=UPI0015BFA4A7|nr:MULTISPECIES: hypothetical protein [unclassified Sediminibacterium]MBW0160161.1 hypothetical protein [Sediminibacterium sp.]MBW0164250.1 hypothetical protein [Sediminibacterium sp.]NWK65458.1 hypothetical protein [Sediminibacterium sp. Gen4]
MDQLEEINELSLGDIVVRSSVQLFVVDKDVLKPIAFGTGFMLHHRERLFFVSVRHVTDYDQYHTYLETNRQGTEEGTPIRPQGGFCYFDLYKVADAKDIKEFEDLFKEGEMLDITFSEMKGEIGLLQPEIDFGSFKVNGGTKIVIDSSSIAEPDKNKYYALFGKIKHDYHGKMLHAVNAFKGDLKFHRTKNNFHMFLAPNIIINKDEYQGCSGAPIFDSDGYLTAVVCQIVTNTKIVMGFSIQECISLLNIAIDTNLIDEKN